MSASRLVKNPKINVVLLPIPKIRIPKTIQVKITALIAKIKVPRTSSNAASSLVKLGHYAIPALTKLLKEKVSGLRAIAAESLGNIQDRRATPILIRTLRDKDASVRSIAALSLGKIGDQRATPALIRALKDKNKDVRSDTALSLGDLQDVRAVNKLMDLLNNPIEQPDVRITAAQSLGKIGDPRALSSLQFAKNNDLNIEVIKAVTAAERAIKRKSRYSRRPVI